MVLHVALCDDDKITLNDELQLIKGVLDEKKLNMLLTFLTPLKSYYSLIMSIILCF